MPLVCAGFKIGLDGKVVVHYNHVEMGMRRQLFATCSGSLPVYTHFIAS